MAFRRLRRFIAALDTLGGGFGFLVALLVIIRSSLHEPFEPFKMIVEAEIAALMAYALVSLVLSLEPLQRQLRTLSGDVWRATQAADQLAALAEIAEQIRTLQREQMKAMSVLSDEARANAQLGASKLIASDVDLARTFLDESRTYFDEWIKVLKQEVDRVPESSPFWRRVIEVYMAEERDDITHFQIASNVQAYWKLLHAAVEFLINPTGDVRQSVVLYAVTPVLPEDWWNYPTGSSEKKQRQARPELDAYRNMICSLIESYPKELTLKRWILARTDDPYPERIANLVPHTYGDIGKQKHRFLWFDATGPICVEPGEMEIAYQYGYGPTEYSGKAYLITEGKDVLGQTSGISPKALIDVYRETLHSSPPEAHARLFRLTPAHMSLVDRFPGGSTDFLAIGRRGKGDKIRWISAVTARLRFDMPTTLVHLLTPANTSDLDQQLTNIFDIISNGDEAIAAAL